MAIKAEVDSIATKPDVTDAMSTDISASEAPAGAAECKENSAGTNVLLYWYKSTCFTGIRGGHRRGRGAG